MWMTVARPPFWDLERFDEVLAQLGGEPEGMEARWAGMADDGTVRVVALWRSQADAERFFVEQLGPAFVRVLGPEPLGSAETLGIEVSRTYVPEAVG